MASGKKFLDEEGASLLYSDLRNRIFKIQSENPPFKNIQEGKSSGSFKSSISTPETADYSLGKGSVALGENTSASGSNQLVFGQNNTIDNSQVEIVGWGNSQIKSNIRTLDQSGNMWIKGDVRVGGNNFNEGQSLIISSISTEVINNLFIKK